MMTQPTFAVASVMTSDILTCDFFQLFEVPVSFEVDLDLIKQRYMDLQKAVHPDKFVNASAQEKRISMQHTSRINEALNTLKQPVDRALYLLKLKGMDINFENETTMDASFLMEQIEMREALSEVRKKNDPLAELDRVAADVKLKTKNMMNEFSKCYEEDRLDEARELIRKMQFMQKAKKEINELSSVIEDELY
jgi:molecular chaperone HscB